MSTDLKRLDQLDVLLAHFRQIEMLFRLMENAGPGDESELVRSCAEIGLALAIRFREVLEKEMAGTEGGTR